MRALSRPHTSHTVAWTPRTIRDDIGKNDQFSSKRQFGHNDDWLISQGVASNQVLPFPCVLLLLPFDNLPSEDDTFHIEDGIRRTAVRPYVR